MDSANDCGRVEGREGRVSARSEGVRSPRSFVEGCGEILLDGGRRRDERGDRRTIE